MNDKQQLAAMGAELRLTEEQAKAMAERMPQTGTLQILDDEPLCTEIRINGVEACGADIGGLLDRCLPHTTEQKPLRMAKRIEELEAQVRALTLPEGWQLVPVEPTREMMASAMSAVTQPQDLLYSQSGWGMNEVAARTRYCAMLAAAPRPEAK